MKIGLFFGSFNPVHTGHLVIANYMATQTDMNQVWLVVSPHNPFKDKKTLANDYDRLHLAHLSVEDNDKLRVSDVEFSLPKPSYTIDTLAYLKEKYPKYEFCLIMGGDNLLTLEKWKNAEIIIRDYPIYVYNRPGNTLDHPLARLPNIHICTAPLMEISSTYIRNCLQNGFSVRYLVPDPVFRYLEKTNLFRK